MPGEPQPKQAFELDNISPDPAAQANRGWEVELNGEVVSVVTSLRIRSQRFGEVAYGSMGYDTWGFHEPGGGGAATVPYAIIDGQLMIGVVAQRRPAAGGVVWEIPRGFKDPGETHDEAARREIHEEAGLLDDGSRQQSLAQGLNPNTTFFNTSGPGEGIAIYGIQVQPEELTQVDNGEGGTHYAFSADIQAQAKGDQLAERILGSKFVPVTEAINTPDMMTIAGVGLLTARFIGLNTLRFAGVEHAETPESQPGSSPD